MGILIMENVSNPNTSNSNLGKKVLGAAVAGPPSTNKEIAAYSNYMQAKANKNSPIKNALITAGMGGTMFAGLEAITQKGILNKKDEFLKIGEQLKKLDDSAVKSINIKSKIIKMLGEEGQDVAKDSKIYKYLEKGIEIAKSGKINIKVLLKGAGITAAFTGALALLLNTIKVKTPEKLQ